MVPVLLLASLLSTSASQQTHVFQQFTFCRENETGTYQRMCFDLDSAGEGVFTLLVRDEDAEEQIPFAFSRPALDRFHELLEDTEYLEEAETYESGRNVANLGTKTITLSGDWGRREAVFNFTTVGEASRLTTFFERLTAQEVLRFETEVALEFDRLGIPEQLDRIQNEIRADRIVDAGRIVSILERIASDSRVVNYARSNATRMAEDLREEFLDFD